MALSKNDGKITRRRPKGFPFAVSRDGQRTVTDRETGTVLGHLSPFGDRWDFNTDLGFDGGPYGFETVTDAAEALHRGWKRLDARNG